MNKWQQNKTMISKYRVLGEHCWGVVIGKGLPEERTPELTSNDCVGATGKRLGENGLDVEGTTV